MHDPPLFLCAEHVQRHSLASRILLSRGFSIAILLHTRTSRADDGYAHAALVEMDRSMLSKYYVVVVSNVASVCFSGGAPMGVSEG